VEWVVVEVLHNLDRLLEFKAAMFQDPDQIYHNLEINPQEYNLQFKNNCRLNSNLNHKFRNLCDKFRKNQKLSQCAKLFMKNLLKLWKRNLLRLL
jgi:hypothetical protein